MYPISKQIRSSRPSNRSSGHALQKKVLQLDLSTLFDPSTLDKSFRRSSIPSSGASTPIACVIQTFKLRIFLNSPLLLLRTPFWVQGCRDGVLGLILGGIGSGVWISSLGFNHGDLVHEWWERNGEDSEERKRKMLKLTKCGYL